MPGCLLEEPRRQSAAGIALWIPKRVDLGLAWTQVPAAGVETLLAAAWSAQDAGARHPITPGAKAEIGGKEARRCILETRLGLRRPQPGQRSREQTRQQVVGTASTAGLPGRLPSRAHPRGLRGPATP